MSKIRYLFVAVILAIFLILPTNVSAHGMMGFKDLSREEIQNLNDEDLQEMMLMHDNWNMGWGDMGGYGVLNVVVQASLITFLLTGSYWFVKQSGK